MTADHPYATLPLPSIDRLNHGADMARAMARYYATAFAFEAAVAADTTVAAVWQAAADRQRTMDREAGR